MNPFKDMFKAVTPAASNPPVSQASAEKPLSIPGDPATAAGVVPGTPVNAMDAYNKMYENANKDTSIQAPVFKIDPKVLGEVSRGMDFVKGVDPALMEKAMGGDAKSMIQLMQSVSQNAYSASLEHATALTETHLGQRAAYDSSRVDKGVRQQLTTNALSEAPNYSHPVVRQELNRVATQYAAANPDASPQQVAKAAQKYISDLHTALQPQQTPEQQREASGEMDWTKYLS